MVPEFVVRLIQPLAGFPQRSRMFAPRQASAIDINLLVGRDVLLIRVEPGRVWNADPHPGSTPLMQDMIHMQP
jgi:hypothetical protein